MAAQLTERWTHSVWRQVAQIVAADLPKAPPAPTIKRHRQVQIRLGTAKVDALLADYLAGSSITAVAQEYRVDHDTARRHLLLAGLVLRPRKTGIPPSEREHAQLLRVQGWSWVKIGQAYGCSRTAARNAVLGIRG